MDIKYHSVAPDERIIPYVKEMVDESNMDFTGVKIRMMPDAHPGKDCCIGFSAVGKFKMIDPRIVGIDIGCGLTTLIFNCESLRDEESMQNFLPLLDAFIKSRELSPDNRVNQEKDVAGVVTGALISDKYIDIARQGFSTLGGGNHFIEFGQLEESGLFAITVHSGSRGLGGQVFRDVMEKSKRRDRSVECQNLVQTAIDINKREGTEHLISQEIARIRSNYRNRNNIVDIAGGDVNYGNLIDNVTTYAKNNRTSICEDIFNFFKKTLEEQYGEQLDVESLDLLNSSHNTIEKISADEYKILKGAASAKEGEAVIIPINLRDGIILGVGKGNPDWNSAAPHGAGRLKTRTAAKLDFAKSEDKTLDIGSTYSTTIVDCVDELPSSYRSMDYILQSIEDNVEVKDIIKPIYNFKQP